MGYAGVTWSPKSVGDTKLIIAPRIQAFTTGTKGQHCEPEAVKEGSQGEVVGFRIPSFVPPCKSEITVTRFEHVRDGRTGQQAVAYLQG